MSTFRDFPLNAGVLEGIEAMGFTAPLPIQQQVIPAALEGRDIIGCSQTGTGKTAAYLIPIIEGLLELGRAARYRPRALVLAPTRELAAQVGEHFRALARATPLRVGVVHGGAEHSNEDRQLQEGVDLLVATPGRLLDHLGRGGLAFSQLEYLVIDEADRLLDAGFLPELRRVIDALPERRQTMLFSATMPTEMEELARQILLKPVRLQVGLVATREQIHETFWPVAEKQKGELLERVLAREQGLEKVIVFVRTRGRAAHLAPMLANLTKLPTAELHADLTQAERSATIAGFRDGTVRLLVATDVAARGLDIQGLTHVVNYDVPNTPDDYIHRVGRTGRVDRPGVAITLVSPRDLILSAAIESATRRRIATRRLEGFVYEMEDGAEEPDFGMNKLARQKTAARKFRERQPGNLKDGRKPFTRSGQLKPEFRDPEMDMNERQRRKMRKRLEKRILNKKLPHQRKRGTNPGGPQNPPPPRRERPTEE